MSLTFHVNSASRWKSKLSELEMSPELLDLPAHREQLPGRVCFFFLLRFFPPFLKSATRGAVVVGQPSVDKSTCPPGTSSNVQEIFGPSLG